MIKRFVIAAILVALFLGGVGYLNLVFKPKMIGEFMAKMKPPAATVTAERAGTKEWIDRVQSIGTLIAIRGVDVSPEVAGIVKDYYFESGNDVEKGAKLVELDTSVEEADLLSEQAQAYSFDRPSNGWTEMRVLPDPADPQKVTKAALLRTARLLMRGEAMVPASVWPR